MKNKKIYSLLYMGTSYRKPWKAENDILRSFEDGGFARGKYYPFEKEKNKINVRCPEKGGYRRYFKAEYFGNLPTGEVLASSGRFL